MLSNQPIHTALKNTVTTISFAIPEYMSDGVVGLFLPSLCKLLSRCCYVLKYHQTLEMRFSSDVTQTTEPNMSAARVGK